MASAFRFMKNKEYSRPHQFNITWGMGLETGVNNKYTSLALCRYDEGLGDPSGYNANPKHASFAEAAEANCYPESKVFRINAELELSLTKDFLVTDNLEHLKMMYMVYAVAFDDIAAVDELSTLTIGDVLELQTESTDNQCYPVWNGVDTIDTITNKHNMPANEPGLTTDQSLEGIDFSLNDFYDMLQYGTISKKLQRVQYGLKWFELSRNNSSVRIPLKMKRKAKAMNENTVIGVIVGLPPASNQYQHHLSTDTTNVTHVQCQLRCRFDEWNSEFDFGRV